MMNKSLRILIIEDSEDDTILLTRKLRQSGYEPLYERIDTRKKMEESLKKQSWDLILCDYSMPNFNAIEALAILQKSGLDIPFIIISGTIGENIAVEAVKAGASDYMLKDNLIRLLPAIDRELRELKNRRAKKLAEEAHIKSEQNLRNIISASMDGVVVVDENGIVCFVNPAAEKMFGRERNMVVGSIFGHPTTAGEVIQIDIVKPDGEIVIADMRTVETTWEGKHCFLTILRDFTDQKRLQDALTESEEKLRALIEHSSDLIQVTDQDGYIRYVSPSIKRILGYTSEEVIGKDGKEFIHPDDIPEVVEGFNRAKENPGVPVFNICRCKHKDGSWRIIESTGINHFNTPVINGYISNKRDITERKQMEQAIKESEERYRNLIENADQAICVFQDEKIIFANSKIEEISGYTVEEVNTMPPEDLFHPDDKKYINRPFADLEKDKKTSGECSFRIIAKDGRTVWLNRHITEIIWEGRPAHLIFDSDITERKKAGEERQESERKYRQLLENLHEGIWVIDNNTNTTFVNERMAEMLGYTIKEMLGKSLFDFMSEIEKEKATHLWERRQQGIKEQHEFEFICKDNSVIYTLLETSPIFDESNNFNGAIAGVLNITERVRAEQLFHDMFTTSAIGMYIIQNGIFRLTNPQFRKNLGYTEAELFEKSFQDIVYSEDQQRVIEKATAMLKGESASPYEYRYITGSGEIRWASESVASIDYYGTKATLGTSMDITELKKLEQELLTSSKLASVGELAAGIAHEINNPLTGVMGFAQLLVEKKEIPREISKDLESIYQESKRAVRIVQNLLRFARQYKPEKKYIDINELIESTLELQSYELKINNIRVEKNLGTSIPFIIGDYNQLQQVILNIVVNAQQAITEIKSRGKLVITTSSENGQVKISIADNGPGITSENISKIFDPFFTTKQVGKGSGLGLSVCHGFITEHGGKLYVESTEGKGATFFIELPIMLKNMEVAKEKETVHTKTAKIKSEHTGRILVVDDEPTICDILEKMLDEEGHEIDTARSGRIAINKLAGNEYDACIIDLKMPGMSGSELFTTIEEKYPGLTDKVLFITGDTITADTYDLLQSMGRPYLTKPFDYNKLIELINSLLGESHDR